MAVSLHPCKVLGSTREKENFQHLSRLLLSEVLEKESSITPEENTDVHSSLLTFNVKQGTPTDEELEELAMEIAEKWKMLGICLGIREEKLLDLKHDYEQLSERGYHMLMYWKQKNGSAATYQTLVAALQHRFVRRKDLAETICNRHGTPADKELEELGKEIAEQWKMLGNRLGVKEQKVQDIEQRYEQLIERGYHMLMNWKQENGPAATYETLVTALHHELVQRKDLAETELSRIELILIPSKIAEENEDDSQNPVGTFLSPFAGEKKYKNLVATAMEFEAMHKECVRVLPYSKDGHRYVHFYVLYGKSGIPPKLKDAAREYFSDVDVDLEWFDLYQDANEIVKISPIQYPTGTPQRLDESQIQAINKMINANLHLLVRHRNITSVQPSLKIRKSKQTKTPCITIYVLRKGFIPDGECAFPLTLGSYPVDVVDGFWFRTDDPWRPNEAQQQSEVLCLGASIGVKDEDAAGTLGAIVKGGETFYALSCHHVIGHETKIEITHPARNDHLNYLSYHLQQYRLCTKQMIGRDSSPILKSLLAGCTFTGSEELSSRFQEMKRVKETFLDPARKTKRRLRASDLHEKAFEEGLTPPRVIGKYTAGVSRNVLWTDGQQYYIDAAIAELTSEEVEGLHESQTAELIGTGSHPSGKCSSNVKASGELCKSGRTTEFTKSGRHVQPSMFLNASLFDVKAQKEQLVNVLKRIKLCQICLQRSETGQNLDAPQSACDSCEKDTATLKEKLWFKNCLCIDHPFDLSCPKVFATKGDSGAVLFETEENKRLRGFGIIFGEHRNSYQLCALASPLQVALETLSKEISLNTGLRLFSIYE